MYAEPVCVHSSGRRRAGPSASRRTPAGGDVHLSRLLSVSGLPISGIRPYTAEDRRRAAGLSMHPARDRDRALRGADSADVRTDGSLASQRRDIVRSVYLDVVSATPSDRAASAGFLRGPGELVVLGPGLGILHPTLYIYWCSSPDVGAHGVVPEKGPIRLLLLRAGQRVPIAGVGKVYRRVRGSPICAGVQPVQGPLPVPSPFRVRGRGSGCARDGPVAEDRERISCWAHRAPRVFRNLRSRGRLRGLR